MPYLVDIQLINQLISPSPGPGIVGNLHIRGYEERQLLHFDVEVDDHTEDHIRWMLEARDAQRKLLEEWLTPIQNEIL